MGSFVARTLIAMSVIGCMGQMQGDAQRAAGADKPVAQTHATFEVASMRLVPTDGQGYFSISPPGAGTLIVKNASGRLLLEFAFGIEPYQFSGVPVWADSTYYDVSAKPGGDAALTYEQMRPMLQSLLQERLKLATHWSDANKSGYALELRKGETGKRLTASTGATGGVYILADGIQGDNVSMKTFAALLARVIGVPVVDDTGLSGVYRIRMKFAPLSAADSSLPSLPSALQDMGLALNRRKVQVRMLTVDHMERVPAEN